MDRLWRLAMTAMALLVAALTWGGAVAQAHTVSSTDFGKNGRVGTIGQISYPFGHEYTAVAGSGDIYVAAEPEAGGEFGAAQLRRYLPDGKLDPSFGEGGAVVLSQLAGMSFRLSELLVDSNGLPYLIGTTFGPQTAMIQPYPYGAIRPVYATVARYTTAGTLDRTYGKAGVAFLDFGLPAPEPTYEKPTVYGSRAVIDQQDRIVLVASQQEIEARGPTHSAFYEDAKLVARLTPTGALDTSFGEGGTEPIPSLAVDGLGVDAKGRVQLVLPPADSGEASFRLLRLFEDGRPDGSFGTAGLRAFRGIGAARALAVESDGGSLVLGTSAEPSPHQGGTETPVMKIGSRAKRGRGFGRGNPVRIHLPGQSYLSEIVEDRNGGAYLVGTQVTRLPGTSDWRKVRRQGLVLHLEADGELDTGFGDHGRLVVRSPSQILGKGVQLTAGGRRLLVDGLATSPAGTSGAHQFLAEYNAPKRVVYYR